MFNFFKPKPKINEDKLRRLMEEWMRETLEAQAHYLGVTEEELQKVIASAAAKTAKDIKRTIEE